MSAPAPFRLKDYRPPAYLVDSVHLTFKLAPSGTRVTSRIAFRPNPASEDNMFRLDGEHLRLIWAKLDGRDAVPEVSPSGLSLEVPHAPFIWEAEVEIDPVDNTALEGLYISGGLYCTQCEAEGFRRITYYPDRPDVLSVFTVRVEHDAPVLLSNGNLVATGPGWAEWHDPWPKPAYLFALVAGDLVATKGQFTTMEGRDVDLAIWTREGNETKADYALDALVRSMEWDEKVYGRAYDLDVFNIVAVDDFNAGAMENKGLNIFNAKYVLASPETATDTDYELIEGIIAHEYFHNWTGNRITCRDWFQLCLKEGLTVFRDQQFSGDMRSAAVKRIDDALALRNSQFREDAGPLAHPVRPEEFVEINNFYTATVYEKGAEVIGMLKTLVGDDAYYKALDLYFARHDGQAATIEDWLQVFEDTTGRDLSQFKLWYSQAGTPKVEIRVEAADAGTWKIIASQSVPPTPGQPNKDPMVIPVRLQAFDAKGTALLEGHDQVAVLDTQEAVLAEVTSDAPPVVSAFRGFSAPVIVEQALESSQRLFLLSHDTDPFNRWDAGRRLIKDALLSDLIDGQTPDAALFDALRALAEDEDLDPAFRAFTLDTPSEDDLAQTLHVSGHTPDPMSIYKARRRFNERLAEHMQDTALTLQENMKDTGPFSPDASAAGRRALRMKALYLLTLTEGPGRAQAAFTAADNMTVSIGTLSILLNAGFGDMELAAFYERWQDNRLVMDKWFALQIARATPERAVGVAERLTEHELFEWTNPNRFRAVLGALIGNRAGFHAANGSGYDFVADWLIRLDGKNPQTAARLSTAFESWRRYDADRQQLMKDAMGRIRATQGLSPDTTEMLDRMLAD